MKATTLFKSCLLACSVLAGAHAIADPIAVSTINSIEFSFMNYSSTPLPGFGSLPLPGFDNTPSPVFGGAPSTGPAAGSPAGAPSVTFPLIVPTPQETKPIIDAAVPSTPGQPMPSQLIEAPVQPQQVEEVPEPGTLALLGLGLAFLGLRRREQAHG